ncbi:hypothetical protein CS022_24655 [Veronia nyctiphanis]|uniref:SHOCT domain-containing protein n=1 Tax=Veronia nyctiphanis TaxID=1278244 RepID=A0A4Q0Y7M6_9GAMM|nr:SHOCT domain-containing protein [Veronia nyctiphanis]RXJ66190.1 hypothetical protein CS022_24655 [Veronia nyctiphanis]
MFFALYVIFLIVWVIITISIASKNNHPYKTPIIILALLGLFIPFLLLGSFIWAFIVPKGGQTSSVAVSSVAEELEKLHDLRERGVLSEKDYTTQKAKLLG